MLKMIAEKDGRRQSICQAIQRAKGGKHEYFTHHPENRGRVCDSAILRDAKRRLDFLDQQ